MKLNKSPFVIIWVIGSILFVVEPFLSCNCSIVRITAVILTIIGLIGTVLTQSKKQ